MKPKKKSQGIRNNNELVKENLLEKNLKNEIASEIKPKKK